MSTQHLLVPLPGWQVTQEPPVSDPDPPLFPGLPGPTPALPEPLLPTVQLALCL